MNNTAREILEIIAKHLEKYPTERFGQALFNLGINEFEHKGFIETRGYALRDIYNDLDINILEKLKKQQQEWNK